jgi:hypothetical protein
MPFDYLLVASDLSKLEQPSSKFLTFAADLINQLAMLFVQL